MIKNLGTQLACHPMIMAIYGIDQLKVALTSRAQVCIIANIDLIKLQPVITLLAKADKYVIVNIDSCNGLSQDKGGIDYIAETGAMGLLSTRLQTVQRAKKRTGNDAKDLCHRPFDLAAQPACAGAERARLRAADAGPDARHVAAGRSPASAAHCRIRICQ
jgi:hypothetical protein